MSFLLDRSQLYEQFCKITDEFYARVEASPAGKKHVLYFEQGSCINTCRVSWKAESTKRKRDLTQEEPSFLGQGTYGQVFSRHREGEEKKAKKILLRPTSNLVGAIREFFLFNVYHRRPGQTYRLAVTVNHDRRFDVRMTLPFLPEKPIITKYREFREDLVPWLNAFAEGLDSLYKARQYGIALFDVKTDNLIGLSCVPCDFGSALFKEEFSDPDRVIVACPELRFLTKTLGLSPSDPTPSYADDIYALSLSFLGLLGFSFKEYYRRCSAPDADFKVALEYRERFMEEVLKPGFLKGNFSPILTERMVEIFRNLIPLSPSGLFSLNLLPFLSDYFKALCRTHKKSKETQSARPYDKLDEVRFLKSLKEELDSKIADRKVDEGDDLETESGSDDENSGDEEVFHVEAIPPLAGAGGPGHAPLLFCGLLLPAPSPTLDASVDEIIGAEALRNLRGVFSSGRGGSRENLWTQEDDDLLTLGGGPV
jgi:hypothetical protein